MSEYFSEKYEEEGTFDNLLLDRFSRFDYVIKAYLIESTKEFFEDFLSQYLRTEIEPRDSYGIKEFPKPILNHEITENDLLNIATSNFGLTYLIILDEVLVNKIKELGKYDLKTAEDNINSLNVILNNLFNNLELIENELFFLKKTPNRLDHLQEIEIYRQRNISDIFLNGVNTDSYLIRVPFKIDWAIQEFQKNKFYSDTLSHIFLSWLLLIEASNFSSHMDFDKLSTNIFLDNDLISSYDEEKGFIKSRKLLELQEIGLSLLFRLFKFALVFSALYLIFDSKNILRFLNINDDYHWILSIFLIALMYLGLKKNDEFKTITHKRYSKNLELIESFRNTQFILHLDSYHPETLKSQLLNIEKKGVVVPESMYLILSEYINNNELISRPRMLEKRKFHDPDFKTSSRDSSIFTLGSRVLNYGDIEIIREKNKIIKYKHKYKDDTNELRWFDKIEFSVSAKSFSKVIKIEESDENNNKFKKETRISCEFNEINGGSLFDDEIVFFYENAVTYPKAIDFYLESYSQEMQTYKLSQILKKNSKRELPDNDGIGYIRLSYDHELEYIGNRRMERELYVSAGINDSFYENMSDQIFKDKIEEIIFSVKGGAYISGDIVIGDRNIIFIDLSGKDNIFKISEMHYKNSSDMGNTH